MTSSAAFLADTLGYRFKNPQLLQQALSPAAAGQGLMNNERLEFLGDRVVGLVLAEALYMHFSGETEGDLAKRHAALVQGPVMTELAFEIGLDKLMVGITPTSTMLADAFEAIIGAIYLDSDFDTAGKVIMTLWGDRVHNMAAPPQDPKTALQEWAQARALPVPVYTIAAKEGPDHAPSFTVEVTMKGYSPVRATGKSRREAEKVAAQNLLDTLNA
jgi:ribonuclease-3